MIDLELFGPVRSVLAIGAHPDDIEIGCGGTLRRIHREQPDVEFSLVILTGAAERAAEAAAAAARFCGPDTVPTILRLRDSYLPYEAGATKDALRAATTDLDPDVIFTHRRDDLHQDHAYVADLTWQLFRDHLILEYEIPKYDGGLGDCNLYVPLSEADAAAKIEDIVETFASQRQKYWMRPEVLEATMRLRGVEARVGEVLAEGFVARRLVAR